LAADAPWAVYHVFGALLEEALSTIFNKHRHHTAWLPLAGPTALLRGAAYIFVEKPLKIQTVDYSSSTDTNIRLCRCKTNND
jgi:hypothetical protein